MIERVRRQVAKARRIDRAIVATDDERIVRAVQDHGGEAVLTGEHPNGTHRVAAVARVIRARYVVNVQGDMPLLDPKHVDDLVGLLEGGAPIATLAVPFALDPASPHVVKVVRNRAGDAMYFSRAAIPSQGPWLRHLGLYGFGEGTLDALMALPEGILDRAEDLEQLRWLEAGFRIVVGVVESAEPGVDTPDQLEAARQRFHELFPSCPPNSP